MRLQKIENIFIFVIIVAISTILIMIFAASCNMEKNPSPLNKSVIIGYSSQGPDIERWRREKVMAEDYAKKHNFILITADAQQNSDVQIKQSEKLIYEGAKVLIVIPFDQETTGKIAKIAKENGVPVIAYDRLIKNGPVDYYISFNQEKVGMLQAQELIKKYPKGNYVFLKGAPTDFNTSLYEKGSRKVLQPYIDRGDIKIIAEHYCKGWYNTEAYKHMINVLSKTTNITAVIAPNDDTARAAIEALKKYGLAGKVGVSGQDADLESIKAILKGNQTMTVYKPINKMNEEAFKLALDLVAGKKPKTNGFVYNNYKNVPTLFLDVVPVTKQTINQTVIKDNFYTADQVYRQ